MAWLDSRDRRLWCGCSRGNSKPLQEATKLEGKRDLRNEVEGLIIGKREHFLSGDEEERMMKVFLGGENGVVEEILGEKKSGSPKIACQVLETHLNRIKDFSGSLGRIFTTTSWGRWVDIVPNLMLKIKREIFMKMWRRIACFI